MGVDILSSCLSLFCQGNYAAGSSVPKCRYLNKGQILRCTQNVTELPIRWASYSICRGHLWIIIRTTKHPTMKSVHFYYHYLNLCCLIIILVSLSDKQDGIKPRVIPSQAAFFTGYTQPRFLLLESLLQAVLSQTHQKPLAPGPLTKWLLLQKSKETKDLWSRSGCEVWGGGERLGPGFREPARQPPATVDSMCGSGEWFHTLHLSFTQYRKNNDLPDDPDRGINVIHLFPPLLGAPLSSGRSSSLCLSFQHFILHPPSA